MDKRVIQNDGQLSQAIHDLRQWDFTYPMSLQFKRYVRPRTSGQQAKIHCMFDDIGKSGGISGEQVKTKVKNNEFLSDGVKWPGTWEKSKLGQLTHEGKRLIWQPKSESALSVKEESLLIEQLYAFGYTYSVEWSENDI